MGRVWTFGRVRGGAHMESERASHRGEEAEGGWNNALMIQQRVLLFPTAWAGVVVLEQPWVDPWSSEDDRVCARARLR